MPNHNEVAYSAPRSVRARHDEVVAMIRQNPGISKGELAKLLYCTSDERGRLGSMLTQLCFVKRIKYQDVHRYSVVEAE